MNREKRHLLQAMLVGLRDQLMEKYPEVGCTGVNIRNDENGTEIGVEQMALQDKKKIQAIDHALARLQLDQYDRCESCGGMITYNQLLESLPWTTRCTACSPSMNYSADGDGNTMYGLMLF